MKTFYFSLDKAFKKGLRPRADIPAEGEYLTLCENAKPSPQGLVTAGPYTRTFNLNEDAYVFNCYAGVFVLTATTLYTYDLTTQILTSQVTGIPSQLPWSCADFKAYIVFTNGLCNVIRAADGTFTKDYGTKLPIAGTICAHRGRAILGNLKYDASRDIDWGNSNWVAWSEIGYLEFLSLGNLATTRKNTSGFMPMPWAGKVYKVLPLGKNVIVYGDGGISALFPAQVGNTMTYGLKDISTIGLLDETSVTMNGDEDSATKHYLIRADGMVCSIDTELKFTELGYKEFFAGVITAAYTSYLANGTYFANGSIQAIGAIKTTTPQVRMFFNSSLNELYLSTSSKTYILTEFGMGSAAAIMKDGFYSDLRGLIMHSNSATAQGYTAFTSDLLTFGGMGLKSIEFAILDLLAPPSILPQVAVEVRKNPYESFTSSSWKTINGTGAVRISAIGLQFRVKFQYTSYPSSGASSLAGMKLAVQFRDKRYTRGISASTGAAKDAQSS